MRRASRWLWWRRAQVSAFLLEGGFAVNPEQNVGNVFMKYGNALVFHTKVDFTRLAYQR